MFCPGCRASLPIGAKFCQDCGAAVPVVEWRAADPHVDSEHAAIAQNADGIVSPSVDDHGLPAWELCSSCDRLNRPGSSVCNCCGLPIAKTDARATFGAVTPGVVRSAATSASRDGLSVLPSISKNPTSRPFADIPIWKVVLLSIATSGIYGIVWFYRQWKAVRVASGRRLWPAARAVLSPFFIVQLFSLIEQAQPSHATFPGRSIAVGWLAIVIVDSAFGVFARFGMLPALPWHVWSLWQLGFFGLFVGVLVIAQTAATRANIALVGFNPRAPERFSVSTGLAVAAGAVNWALSIWLAASAPSLVAGVMASEANRGLPRKVDEATELTRVSAEANRLIYDYTVLQRWRRTWLVTQFRQKYPGAYDDVADEELQHRILTKYPEYNTPEWLGPAPMEDRPEERHLGKQNVAAVAPETVFGPAFDARAVANVCAESNIHASMKLGITYVYRYTSADGVPLHTIETTNASCGR